MHDEIQTASRDRPIRRGGGAGGRGCDWLSIQAARSGPVRATRPATGLFGRVRRRRAYAGCDAERWYCPAQGRRLLAATGRGEGTGGRPTRKVEQQEVGAAVAGRDVWVGRTGGWSAGRLRGDGWSRGPDAALG